MATIHENTASRGLGNGEGAYRVMVKGVPEVVVDACRQVQAGNAVEALTPTLRDGFLNQNRELAEQGLRMLAVAE